MPDIQPKAKTFRTTKNWYDAEVRNRVRFEDGYYLRLEGVCFFIETKGSAARDKPFNFYVLSSDMMEGRYLDTKTHDEIDNVMHEGGLGKLAVVQWLVEKYEGTVTRFIEEI